MRSVLGCLMLVFAIVVSWGGGMLMAAERTVHELFADFFVESIALDPERNTQLGDLTQFGVNHQDDRLRERSDDALGAMYQLYKSYQAELQSVPREGLTPEELVQLKTLEWYIDDFVKCEEFIYHPYLINQMDGVQISLPDFMVNMHPLRDRTDAQNYIKRLAMFGQIFDQVITAAKVREERGIIPPAYIIDSVRSQCMDFLNAKTKNNVLYSTFVTRLKDVSKLTKAEKRQMADSVEEMLNTVVIPAFNRLMEYLAELRPKSTLKAGVLDLPNGKEYYQYVLQHYTNTDLTPEEIHNLGLAEVERILLEMADILKEMGVSNPILPNDTRYVASQSKSFSTEKQVFGEYQRIFAEVEKRLPELFELLPKGRLALARVPAFREGSISNYYQEPPLDNSREGTFYINLSFRQQRYSMVPLAYHEGIPGHHLQLAIQNELAIPTIHKTLFFGAYIEGWALYAERLAYENDFYPDLGSKFGYLQSELLRACRLVIDTGLHYKGWTRSQAIQYLQSTLGYYSPAEIDRYIVWPGQAVSYKMGELKILELREKAQETLGEKFDIKEFHRVILQNGAVPLGVLEEEVMAYIQSKVE